MGADRLVERLVDKEGAIASSAVVARVDRPVILKMRKGENIDRPLPLAEVFGPLFVGPAGRVGYANITESSRQPLASRGIEINGRIDLYHAGWRAGGNRRYNSRLLIASGLIPRSLLRF